MEREFFDFDGWDGDIECMTFYKVVLKQQIGKFPVGTQFSSASIVLRHSEGDTVLQLHNKDGNVLAEFRLHYRVGEQIYMAQA
jgi:hypothetical protein